MNKRENEWWRRMHRNKPVFSNNNLRLAFASINFYGSRLQHDRIASYSKENKKHFDWKRCGRANSFARNWIRQWFSSRMNKNMKLSHGFPLSVCCHLETNAVNILSNEWHSIENEIRQNCDHFCSDLVTNIFFSYQNSIVWQISMHKHSLGMTWSCDICIYIYIHAYHIKMLWCRHPDFNRSFYFIGI